MTILDTENVRYRIFNVENYEKKNSKIGKFKMQFQFKNHTRKWKKEKFKNEQVERL